MAVDVQWSRSKIQTKKLLEEIKATSNFSSLICLGARVVVLLFVTLKNAVDS